MLNDIGKHTNVKCPGQVAYIAHLPLNDGPAAVQPIARDSAGMAGVFDARDLVTETTCNYEQVPVPTADFQKSATVGAATISPYQVEIVTGCSLLHAREASP